VTTLGSPGLVVCLFCVSGSGSSEVVGDYVPWGNPCSVRSLLSYTWSIWRNDLPKTYINLMWGLAK
jgi:hypothetical protein